MKKTLLSLFALAMTLGATAQTTDAADYFDGNAWGFATVSDEAGTAYQMDGGMRAAQPKTIILTSNGKDMAADIISAIANYDIIVLDGSKGDFIVSAQMGINNAKNKTIVGRNDARLCTQFYLTSEDIAYLKKQNLDGLSSTDQYTGTLPDGTTLTCDKRAFFTKKAMMELQYEKTGVYSLPNRAGIFALSSTDENLIFRNLTMIGPGAVDIDGVDLITNEEATHVWVDHCTFVDSQDGALDSKRCNWATYTWNKFYYTSRSYSHAYTNGCGWANGTMMLHLTWAFNEWGEGCNRRLPQCGDCYVHLASNYHNCPGNSVGMTLNDNCKAIVEYNYAAAGVNSPLTGSGSQRYIYARYNSFSYSSTSTTVTMPYEYDGKILKNNQKVPEVVTAKHGAGATIDDMFMPLGYNELTAETFGFYGESIDALVGNKAMVTLRNLVGANYTLAIADESIAKLNDDGTLQAVAEGSTTLTATVNDDVYGTTTASIKVNVTAASGQYETYKLWNFKRSTETTTALGDSDWSASGDVYTWGEALSNEPLMVDESTPYAEAVGLLFTSPADKLQSYKDRIRFNKENVSNVTIPELKKNDKVLVKWKSASASSSRGFNCTNLSVKQMLTDGTQVTKEATVLEDGDVVLTVTGGLYLYSIEVQRQGGTAVNAVSANGTSKAIDAFFNAAGQRVNGSAKGLIISNGKKFFVK